LSAKNSSRSATLLPITQTGELIFKTTLFGEIHPVMKLDVQPYSTSELANLPCFPANFPLWKQK